MIPASAITATLTADLSYNPSIHVQTVEVDRAGADLAVMATNNFVKWYVTLQDFQNLCWNIRDMPHYNAADDTDVSQNIYAFARSATHTYGADPYTIVDFSDGDGREYANDTSGVVLTQEASGGTVRFAQSSLSMSIPLYSDVPAYGNDLSAGTQSAVGATTVTYDRVMLDDDASGSIAASTRTSASATTTTWAFADTSFNMTVNWVASQSGTESDFSGGVGSDFSYANGPAGITYRGMEHWGTNTISVYASTGASISVTKPHNDAAADFIQIGMDASGSGSTYASGVGAQTSGAGGLGLGTTTFGVAAGDSGSHASGNTDAGLVDPLSANGMTTASADDTTDSIDFTSYFSDYTTNHNDARRNLIEVNIGKPTLKVSEAAFTKGLQQAIDQDGVDVRDVSNSQSLRYAVRDAFLAGHLRGFQAGAAYNDADVHLNNRAMAIPLELPLTVAGQVRKVSAAGSLEAGSVDTLATPATTDDGTGNKTVYLTPVIELVSNDYYHPSWYTYTAVA